jgi:hypothetical protein
MRSITFAIPSAMEDDARIKVAEWNVSIEGDALSTLFLAGLHLLLVTCAGQADFELIWGAAQREYGLPLASVGEGGTENED